MAASLSDGHAGYSLLFVNYRLFSLFYIYTYSVQLVLKEDLELCQHTDTYQSKPDSNNVFIEIICITYINTDL